MKTVTFNVKLTFPPTTIIGDPVKYSGENPTILETLIQKGYTDIHGYFTKSGKCYLEQDESREIDNGYIYFLRDGCYDNYDYDCARENVAHYIKTCPYVLVVTFEFHTSDFTGDPPKYCGKNRLSPLLSDFINKDLYLTRKGIDALPRLRARP